MTDAPTTSSSGLTPSGLTTLAGSLLGLVIVLLLWRYVGINHDGVLYLGQALARRWPDIYGSDLVFVHGTGQERYTLFPWLLSLALGWADAPRVFLWGALASLLGFAAASWYCLRGLLPAEQRCWAWLGVLCLPSAYGMVSIFGYREQFLTPRPIAEALCLVAIGLLARRRWAGAALIFALALAFHPLQAIAAMLIVWPWAVMQNRRWLHAAWLGVPIIALALAGVAPMDGLLRPLDPAWIGALRDGTRQIFVTAWSGVDVRLVGFDVSVLALGWWTLRRPAPAWGAWCAAALAGMALGFGASLVLVDGLHLVLPAGLQLWRVQWLAHLFAMATIGALLFRDIQARDLARALLLALTCLMIWQMPGWSWLLLALLYVTWPKLLEGREARLKRLLGFLFAIGLAGMLAYHVATELLPFRAAHYRLDLYAFDRRILAFPLLALGLPLLGVHAWSRASRKGRWLLTCLVLAPLVAIGALRWDIRSPINKAFEDAAARPGIFGAPLPRNAQVYWGQHMLVGTWLVLQRASYFSPQQISGQVFNRGLAMDGAERLRRMRPLIEEDLFCQNRSLPYETRKNCRISDEAMRRACAPGPGLRPDYLVLPYDQRQTSSGTWVINDPRERIPAITYWLYSCPRVMQELDSAPNGGTRDAAPRQPDRIDSRTGRFAVKSELAGEA